MSEWERLFSTKSNRWYYRSKVTKEACFETRNSPEGEGWVSDGKYFHEVLKLKMYKNLYTGEKRYDHKREAQFSAALNVPPTESQLQALLSRKLNDDDTELVPSVPPSMHPPLSSLPSLPANGVLGRNYLNVLQQNHNEWMFGGLLELIHNSSDAGAKVINIRHFKDINHNDEDVLEVLDDGIGIAPQKVKVSLLNFGNDTSSPRPDRIGCNGVGFQQGTIRVGSTTVFITKSIMTDMITLGILCNRPFEEQQQPFIYEYVVLDYPTCKVNESFCSKEKYRQIMQQIEIYSFLTLESLRYEIEKRFPSGTSSHGTVLFIQHWRIGYDKLVVEYDKTDLRLVDSTTLKPFRKSLRNGNVINDQNVLFDCSLREYLAYAFYEPKINIHLLGREIKCKTILKELSNIEYVTLIDSVDGKPAIRGCFGRYKKWELERIGGAMLYFANVLIHSFERSQIDLRPADGWGIVLVVEIPFGCGIIPKNDKQSFVGSNAYTNLLRKIKEEWATYDLKTTMKIVPLTDMNFTEISDWVQCSNCRKYRRVSPTMKGKYSGELSFYCFSEDSPIMIDLLHRGRENNSITRNEACAIPEDDSNDEDTIFASTGYLRRESTSTSKGTNIVSDFPPEELFHAMDSGDILRLAWEGTLLSLTRRDYSPSNAGYSRLMYENLYDHMRTTGEEAKLPTVTAHQSPFINCSQDLKWAIYMAQREYHSNGRGGVKYPILQLSTARMEISAGGAFDMRTKSAQEASCSKELSMCRPVIDWAISGSVIVLKATRCRTDACCIKKIYNAFPRPGILESRPKRKLHELLEYSARPYSDWLAEFQKSFPTLEEQTSLMSELLVPEDGWKATLANFFDIKPVVPLWLSEPISIALSHFAAGQFQLSARKLTELQEDRRWEKPMDAVAVLLALKPMREQVRKAITEYTSDKTGQMGAIELFQKLDLRIKEKKNLAVTTRPSIVPVAPLVTNNIPHPATSTSSTSSMKSWKAKARKKDDLMSFKPQTTNKFKRAREEEEEEETGEEDFETSRFGGSGRRHWQEVINRKKNQMKKKSARPLPTHASLEEFKSWLKVRENRGAMKGFRIKKYFPDPGDWFVGRVDRLPSDESKYFHVHYEDSDSEEMSENELFKWWVDKPKDSNSNTSSNVDMIYKPVRAASAHCGVCGEPPALTADCLTCVVCNVVVHRTCMSASEDVSTASSTLVRNKQTQSLEFTCQECLEFPATDDIKPRCIYCPDVSWKLYKFRHASGAWIHSICKISDNQSKSGECRQCKQGDDVIKCFIESCDAQMHMSCAWLHGNKLEKVSMKPHQIIRAYCIEHSTAAADTQLEGQKSMA